MAHKKKNLVILGGTSSVALAYAREVATEFTTIMLVGRDIKQLQQNVNDLNARGCKSVLCLTVDLSDTSIIANAWKEINSALDKVDQVLLAYGVLGRQNQSQSEIGELVNLLNVNFVSASIWCELVYESFRISGHGQLTVIGSVAGDRGRQSNYHYGSAKGGLEIFIQGMQHRAAKLKEAKIDILLVKPGFIDTPMTDHLKKKGMLWAQPEQIARIVRKAEITGEKVIYAPFFWWFIMYVVKKIPFILFKRTSL